MPRLWQIPYRWKIPSIEFGIGEFVWSENIEQTRTEMYQTSVKAYDYLQSRQASHKRFSFTNLSPGFFKKYICSNFQKHLQE